MADKPNFLIIWGDDIGYWNISAYSKGVRLRVPKIFNLRTDPFEFADITSNTYWDWLLDHAYLVVPAQHIVCRFLATFKDFPPRQKAASFTVDQVLEKLKEGLLGRV